MTDPLNEPGMKPQSIIGQFHDLMWRDYLQIILERLWIVIAVFATVMVYTVFEIRKQVPLYRTSARVEVAVPPPKAIADDEVLGSVRSDLTHINTQAKLLQSRKMSEGTAALLIERAPRQFPSRRYVVDDLAAEVRGSTSIKQIKGTRMLDIVAIHSDAKKATIVANTMAEAFVKDNLDRRMEASLEVLRWLHDQANQYKKALDEAEIKLQEFREKELASSLVDQQNIVLQKLNDITTSLTATETSRIMSAAEWEHIRAAQGDGAELSDLPLFATNSVVQSIRMQILDKRAEIGAQRTRYKDKHPVVLQLNVELAELEQKCTRACSDAINRFAAGRKMLEAKEEALRVAMQRQQQAAFELDRKLLIHSELVRNVDADRELYNSILTRMKQISVTGKRETNDVRIVDRAIEPAGPCNLNYHRKLIQFGIFGILLGCGLCFVVYFTDDRIRRTEEMENMFGLPLLGVVPSILVKDPTDRSRVSHADTFSPSSEAFRTMRASMALTPGAREVRVLMITSASPAAGKSLVASNLAIVLAQNGQKTLLVDADLRRPNLHRAFGLGGNVGLSRVLAGEMETADAIHSTDIPNLDVMPAGPIPPNPAELIGAPAMQRLLAKDGAGYDRIILDCPPVFGVSDPLSLVPLTGGVVFIVRFNRSHRRQIHHALQKLLPGEVPVLGSVMNDMPVHRRSYYYYYGHYYGYYYETRHAKGKPSRKRAGERRRRKSRNITADSEA